eukprot:gnl/TRDRNA2_/TRDRNA2_190744_c0_seq1.p1 gnl/TRDRNA2_/TRDRNA2_190744_c0~~gnl/TRDRNA2_/TRDRNA2_190744_c0_seq1.p1  ORF type:complete len:226 (+),score=30.86 gnl/TRDRNA2_/TRDRNA2_190744_c0_seq1:68-745(+)
MAVPPNVDSNTRCANYNHLKFAYPQAWKTLTVAMDTAPDPHKQMLERQPSAHTQTTNSFRPRTSAEEPALTAEEMMEMPSEQLLEHIRDRTTKRLVRSRGTTSRSLSMPTLHQNPGATWSESFAVRKEINPVFTNRPRKKGTGQIFTEQPAFKKIGQFLKPMDYAKTLPTNYQEKKKDPAYDEMRAKEWDAIHVLRLKVNTCSRSRNYGMNGGWHEGSEWWEKVN